MDLAKSQIKADLYKDEIVSNLDLLKEIASQKLIKINTYTDSSLNDFEQKDDEKKIDILNTVKNYISILESSKINAQTCELSYSEEIDCLDYALNCFGLKLGDKDYSFIEKNDIIELYSFENKQLYRNLEFLKVCPFDFLTTICHEWFVLFERPAQITEAIMARVAHVMGKNSSAHFPMDIPKHTLIASGHADKILTEVELKYIKPVYDKKTNIKAGFIVTNENIPLLARDQNLNVKTLKSYHQEFS